MTGRCDGLTALWYADF